MLDMVNTCTGLNGVCEWSCSKSSLVRLDIGFGMNCKVKHFRLKISLGWVTFQ
jgi:hypothetical protein